MMTASGPPRRLIALDGLRGVAALVVMFHHIYLVAVPFLRRAGGSAPGSPYWWVSETPLKILTAGTEAVLVFFVLSGLVVALPALSTARFSWSGFLSGRIARIYLPVWASLLLGTVLVWLIPRNRLAVSNGSWVADRNATSTTVLDALRQGSLTTASYDINNVLWSLRWEMAFSVLLPLFVAVAVLVRRCWTLIVVTAGAALIVSFLGLLTHIDALRYLPIFLLGTLMAVRLEDIRRWAERSIQRRWEHIGTISLVVGSAVLLLAHWLFQTIVPWGTVMGSALTQLAVPGAVGLVVAAVGVPLLRRAFESRSSQWLGRISFSLYLVHVPILVTLTFLIGDDRWWLVALLAVPLSLGVGWGFYRVVERPSHRLARHITQGVAGAVARVGARLTTP